MKVLGAKDSKGTTRDDLKQSVEDKTAHRLLKDLAGQIGGKGSPPAKAEVKVDISAEMGKLNKNLAEQVNRSVKALGTELSKAMKHSSPPPAATPSVKTPKSKGGGVTFVVDDLVVQVSRKG